jgi:hypothetical protein
MIDCSKENVCEECEHYSYVCRDFSDCYVCRRLQTVACDKVFHGQINYTGPLLSCHSERGIRLTYKERIFGENKDKCGSRGIYYVRASKLPPASDLE